MVSWDIKVGGTMRRLPKFSSGIYRYTVSGVDAVGAMAFVQPPRTPAQEEMQLNGIDCLNYLGTYLSKKQREI
jgi:hypothetical protein